MRKLILLLLMTLSSCFIPSKESPHVMAWKNVSSKCNAEICKKYSLNFHGEGGSFCNNIQEISTSYGYCVNAPPSLEEARRLILSVHQDAYNCFMNDSRIQPYLNPNPFPSKRFNIMITFHYCNGELVSGKNEIFIVSCSDDKLRYYQFKESIKPLFTETLEEARSRVQACANQNPEQP